MDFTITFLKIPGEQPTDSLKVKADNLSFDLDGRDYVFTSDGKQKARVPSNNVLHITRE